MTIRNHTNRTEKREGAIERMADHVLAEGLGAATLRPLAAAAGTSDRMLLYYFADKDELLTATLARIAQRMLVRLDAAIPLEPARPFATLLQEGAAAMASADLKAYMHVWLDLASGAARGVQPHRAVAGQIADGFLAWIAARLTPESKDAAPLLLAMIEGMALLDALGRGEIATSALSEMVVQIP